MGREPEPGCGAEGGAKLERHLRCNSTAAVDDAVDDLDVATKVIGQGLLGEAEGLEVLLMEDLAGGGGLAVDLGYHGVDLVIPSQGILWQGVAGGSWSEGFQMKTKIMAELE